MRLYTVRVLRSSGASVESVPLLGLCGCIARAWGDRATVSVTVWDCGGCVVAHWERSVSLASVKGAAA